MNSTASLKMLKRWWHDYLVRSGHYLHSTKNPRLSQSRNGKKNRYRWLLFISSTPVLYLSQNEKKLIQQQLKRAKSFTEKLFLVVGFTVEPERVVVLPAEMVLETIYIRSDIGGIEWEE
jgi:hypothetical protein